MFGSYVIKFSGLVVLSNRFVPFEDSCTKFSSLLSCDVDDVLKVDEVFSSFSWDLRFLINYM